jgi:hypothetical protein
VWEFIFVPRSRGNQNLTRGCSKQSMNIKRRKIDIYEEFRMDVDVDF